MLNSLLYIVFQSYERASFVARANRVQNALMFAVAFHDVIKATVVHHHAHRDWLPEREQVFVIVALDDRLMKAQFVLSQSIDIGGLTGRLDIHQNAVPVFDIFLM